LTLIQKSCTAIVSQQLALTSQWCLNLEPFVISLKLEGWLFWFADAFKNHMNATYFLGESRSCGRRYLSDDELQFRECKLGEVQMNCLGI
jgi:hypothetical protein